VRRGNRLRRRERFESQSTALRSAEKGGHGHYEMLRKGKPGVDHQSAGERLLQLHSLLY
jgi:hypothetical protein